VPVVALLATAVFAPLPFSVAQPGMTANVLGENKGTKVITVSGAPVRRTSGQLRMVTIVATGPDARVTLGDVFGSWFRTDRAVMPRDAVYPSGDTVKEIEKHNEAQMKQSQDAATQAALKYLGLSADKVRVTLKLADVGGPSAGLLFTLGIIDKLHGNGSGGDLTGGRTIAGTGTIDASGEVGPIGGIQLKMVAAKGIGAHTFLTPAGNCAEAERAPQQGLTLAKVATLDDALTALADVRAGRTPPTC
jgi:PDZ domain-containing protein